MIFPCSNRALHVVGSISNSKIDSHDTLYHNRVWCRRLTLSGLNFQLTSSLVTFDTQCTAAYKQSDHCLTRVKSGLHVIDIVNEGG